MKWGVVRDDSNIADGPCQLRLSPGKLRTSSDMCIVLLTAIPAQDEPKEAVLQYADAGFRQRLLSALSLLQPSTHLCLCGQPDHHVIGGQLLLWW